MPFYLVFVIFVRDLTYLEPRRGAVCDTAVIDTGLRRSGVSYLGFSYMGFPVVWRGIIVPESSNSAGCWWPLGVSRINGTA